MKTGTVVLVHAGKRHTLRPGGVIGRSAQAALRLDGVGISEMHAYISLRGKALRLLALRGRVEVDGEDSADVELEPGQVLRLGSLLLEVDDVVLPETILLVHGLGPRPLVVEETEASLWLRPEPRLRPGHHAGAELLLSLSPEGWSMQKAAGEAQPLASGTELGPLRLELARLGSQGGMTTTTARRHGLRLHFRRHEVELEGPQGQRLVLYGRLFELLDVLRTLEGEPTPWGDLVGMIWEEEVDPRENFKRLTRRLRNRLVQEGLREDLVRSDGRGRWWMRLLPEDEVRVG